MITSASLEGTNSSVSLSKLCLTSLEAPSVVVVSATELSVAEVSAALESGVALLSVVLLPHPVSIVIAAIITAAPFTKPFFIIRLSFVLIYAGFFSTPTGFSKKICHIYPCIPSIPDSHGYNVALKHYFFNTFFEDFLRLYIILFTFLPKFYI